MKNYRIGQVSKRLKKGITTLLRWERQNRLRFRRSDGGHRYLTEDDMRALLRETQIKLGTRRRTRRPPDRFWWEQK